MAQAYPMQYDLNVAVASDVDAAVAAATDLRLVGYACREADGTPAVAAFNIVHAATGATGDKVIPVELAANASDLKMFWPGIPMPDGISVDHVAGTFEVTLFYVEGP